MKWSYKAVHFELKNEGLLGVGILDESEIEHALNDFGRSGWELVSVLEVQDGIITFFKQPLGMELRYQNHDEDEEVDTKEPEGAPEHQHEGIEYARKKATGSMPEEDDSQNNNVIGAIRIE